VQDDGIEPDARFGWRMLAANNREVARSASTFADIASCVQAVHDLQCGVSDAVAVASRGGRADWSWRLRLDDVEVAASSRTYQRRLQCEAACTLFVELVPDAELVEVRTSGHFVPARRHRLADPVVSPQYGTQRG
jgi:uncharacterized protein YegP (UPF0339 family)